MIFYQQCHARHSLRAKHVRQPPHRPNAEVDGIAIFPSVSDAEHAATCCRCNAECGTGIRRRLARRDDDSIVSFIRQLGENFAVMLSHLVILTSRYLIERDIVHTADLPANSNYCHDDNRGLRAMLENENIRRI